MAEANDTPMMEGFLCPICKGDFGTAIKLLAHFQEEHSEEQDLLKSFKGSFQLINNKHNKLINIWIYWTNHIQVLLLIVC